MSGEKRILLIISLVSLVSVFTAYAIKVFIDSHKPTIQPFSKNLSLNYYLVNSKQKPKKVVYGYLPYWTIDKSKYFQLDKLTDIAYFGLYLNANGSFMTRGEDGNIEPGYNNWRNNEDLKKLIDRSKNSGIRVALTVISHNDNTSDAFLNCRSCWDNFAKNLDKELAHHKIKNVNLNFEYSGYTDESVAPKYSEFVAFVNNYLDKKYGENYLVVAAYADSVVKSRATNIPQLASIVDGVFIMAYDYRTSASSLAGPHAPLEGKGTISEYDVKSSVVDYLKYLEPEQVILGVPYYGYNWVVENNGVQYAKKVDGNDLIGYSISQSYSDIVETLIDKRIKVNWDEPSKTPYFSYISSETGSQRQVYFENKDSLRIKYRLAKDLDIAGVGIWALGYDGGYVDFWDLLREEFY